VEADDIIISIETHIDALVSDGEIFHPWYEIHRQERNRNGGGIFL